jgi:hypothetical protein
MAAERSVRVVLVLRVRVRRDVRGPREPLAPGEHDLLRVLQERAGEREEFQALGAASPAGLDRSGAFGR